jgi:protein-L-isoaspartate(D-aspartate) O-methyltransferase
MTDPRVLLNCMVQRLEATGELPLEWRDAFLTVSRHRFVPDVVWRHDDDLLVPLRRDDDPETWLELAYGPRYVITQVDDGKPTDPGIVGREATSSVSRPNVVARMLAALGAEPGMTVCEIGAGFGYNAALLAARLGAPHVVAVEVDPFLAAEARRTLAGAGYGEVTVITGDGADGYPPKAPYNRVLATVAAPRVPYAWVAQTLPGGRVVTPWATPYHPAGLLSLTVGHDGRAVGRIVDETISFMWLREQRNAPAQPLRELAREEDLGTVSHTELHPAHVANDYDAPFAIGLRVPDCEYHYRPATDDSGEYTVWFTDSNSGSWASIEYTPDSDVYQVRQCGQRRLWDEVETAYQWWVDHERPSVHDWRFTVTPEGQHVALAT